MGALLQKVSILILVDLWIYQIINNIDDYAEKSFNPYFSGFMDLSNDFHNWQVGDVGFNPYFSGFMDLSTYLRYSIICFILVSILILVDLWIYLR